MQLNLISGHKTNKISYSKRYIQSTFKTNIYNLIIIIIKLYVLYK